MRRRSPPFVPALAVLGLAAATLVGCLPVALVGTLAPTLVIEDAGGVPIAVQNGIPVPDFGWQPRARIALDGAWSTEVVALDPELTMADRTASLAAIEEEAAGRQLREYDDAGWGTTEVPGTVNAPPDGPEVGAWYRRTFAVPENWAGRAATLRIGSANYVADVWLNGTWLGYHEGGSTPFALDVGAALLPGERNTLAVRTHTIPLGTRSDVVPWGIIDWWNYGGVTGSVWLEAAPPLHVARADVVPHLDALEVNVLISRATQPVGEPDESGIFDDLLGGVVFEGDRPGLAVTATVLPASVGEENLLNPDPRALVDGLAEPLLTAFEELDGPAPGEVVRPTFTIGFGDADLWTPARPALYVLRVDVEPIDDGDPDTDEPEGDTFWTTFGIRHVAVDPIRPRVLLNGEAVFFRGVGLHGESLVFDDAGRLIGGSPVQAPEEVRAELEDAASIGADLLRTGHQPADPTVLMLADRLGFAVWEEIPMYHATPLIFGNTLARGIPQQMLREMALRDMNRPSVLFHGLANESTGADERAAALAELHAIDREIDGTRLTGQAAYGWDPDDPTQAPLDVAGFTSYHGVFYGVDPGPDTRRALREAHAAHPEKPIMVLEFGRWADTEADEVAQARIFEETFPALEQFRADEPNGFLSAATWWTLHDFATQLGRITVEDFGLVRPDRTLRPAGILALDAFGAPAGQGAELMIEPEIDRPRTTAAPGGLGEWALAAYLAYAVALSLGVMGVLLFVLTRRGGRATGRRVRA